MLTPRDGQPDFVKILDFGLAKVPVELRMKASISAVPGTVSPQLTKVGALYGTPGYMAPEQATSEAVDGRCDLYALGSILYEMLTGRTPFDGNTVLELIDEHLRTPLPPMRKRAPGVEVPEAVEAMVRRLLAKNPEERFRDPRELLSALEQLAPAHPPGAAEPPPTGDSLIMTITANPPPPINPLAARKGTIVAMPAPSSRSNSSASSSSASSSSVSSSSVSSSSGSFWEQLGVLQRTLPSPLRQIPLGLLCALFFFMLAGLVILPWVLR